MQFNVIYDFFFL